MADLKFCMCAWCEQVLGEKVTVGQAAQLGRQHVEQCRRHPAYPIADARDALIRVRDAQELRIKALESGVLRLRGTLDDILDDPTTADHMPATLFSRGEDALEVTEDLTGEAK